MFTWLFELITSFINYGGYSVILLLMILESMIFPIPSEAVMPFAGFLISQGNLLWLGVIIFSSLGSIIGSIISYYIGLYGGRNFIEKYGKYFLLNKKHLEWTEKWFTKNGSLTIFISRFIPIIRHLISVPAGIGRMNIKLFLLFTFLGATIWNTLLVYIGFLLNKNWNLINAYSKQIDICIIILIIIFIVWFIYRKKY
jgi:membrane protein DedA with SNARE-associated domain